jgi:fatty-acyl-CoA synthase
MVVKNMACVIREGAPGMDRNRRLTLAQMIRAAGPDSRLVFADRTHSYGSLDKAASHVAAGLKRSGIGHGDRVALWLDNRSAWLEIFLACARLGAIAVSVNPKFKSKEVGDIVRRSGAKMIAMASSSSDAIQVLEGAGGLGDLRSILDVDSAADALQGKWEGVEMLDYAGLRDTLPAYEGDASSEDGCIIFTTSGTTKAPKFVLHSQGSLIRHGEDVARASEMDAGSVFLLSPPFCGTFGLAAAFSALAVGATMIVPATWDPAGAIRLMGEHKVTHSMMTDDAAAQLLSQSDAAQPLPHIRLIGIAGVNPRLDGIYAEAESRGVRLAGLYGSSELQAIVSLQPLDVECSERQVRGGILVGPQGRVRARDPETGRILDHGEQGELEFLVPDSRMTEYFGNAEATAEAIHPDGYFRSGDLGFSQDDRRFVFLARMGDSLRLGGFLVDPVEIEQVIQSHPAVKEAQVVSIETDRGNRPVAFVILSGEDAFDEEALKAFVGERLAKFKVPVRFHPLDDFPRTVSANAAKVQKSKLREMAAQLPG